MLKIGEFIYPWGSGHYSRMMRLNDALSIQIEDELDVHFSSKDHVIEKLLKKFPEKKEKIHEILMPTPIDGKFGPSISKSLMNILLPIILLISLQGCLLVGDHNTGWSSTKETCRQS